MFSIDLNKIPKIFLITTFLGVVISAAMIYANVKFEEEIQLNQMTIEQKDIVRKSTVKQKVIAKKKIEDLNVFKKKFPKLDIEQGRFETLIFINSLVKEFQILSVETNPEVESEDGIAQVYINIRVAGGFEKIKNLIKKVQDREKNVFVRNIDIDLTDENELNTELQIITLTSDKTRVEKTTFLSNIGNASPFGQFVDFSKSRKELEDLQKELITGKSDDIDSLNNAGAVAAVAKPDFFPLREKSFEAKGNEKYSINLALDETEDIISVESGSVLFAANLKESGNTILIKSNDGNIAKYSNLDAIYVEKGQYARKHAKIASAGSKLPYITFGYMINNRMVDPKNYLDSHMME